MRIRAYALTLLVTISSRAAVSSTVDEWADRFLPEAAPKITLPSYADEYDRAAADITAGKYRAGLCDLAELKKLDAARSDLLRARALIGLGETNAALLLISGPTLASETSAQALAAKTLLENNRLDECGKRIDGLLAADPANLAGHLLKGQWLEARGDFPAAIAAYDWFIDGPKNYLQLWQTDNTQFDNADDIVAFATAIDRWATLTTAYKDVQQLNDTILNMYIRAFDLVDRQSVSARVAAAEFALSRGDEANTEKFAGDLAAMAPLDHDVLRLQLEISVASGNIGAIQSTVGAMRNVDPGSFDASMTEVLGLVHARRVAAGERAALLYAQHPDRLEAIGLYAACAFVNADGEALPALMKKADALSPHRDDAQVIAAQVLNGLMQRPTAIDLLKTAIARTPWETAPRHLLGDLYLNDGYNKEARAVLDEAFKLDPYNLRTVNFLRLLDELDKYAQRPSEHMVVYYDKDADPIAADQIGPFMEKTYSDLVKIFKYTPDTKVVIQIYPNDDEFSVRMAGVPGIENFGVSFGRVLATIAPRVGTRQGNFNWARVLRHEFVHTFNELATQNRCPRWFTEGLAVWQEGVPFRFDGVPREMYKRTMAGELFTIRQFPLAFVQPRQPSDGEQAYTQGAWLAKYLAATYGTDSIVKILAAYGEAKSDEAAFLAGTGRPIDKIEKDWFAWMKTQLAPWHYDEASDKQSQALQKEGEQLLKAKKYAEALNDWQQACDLQPTEVKPHQRLAFLYLQKQLSDPAKAIEHLKFLHVLELQNNRFAKQIARLYIKLNDPANAIAWMREATYVDLYDPAAHAALADLYAQQGQDAEAATERTAAEQIKLWQQKRAADAADAEKVPPN